MTCTPASRRRSSAADTSAPCRSTTWSRCPTPGTRAREWDPQRRRDFANDPRNLLAVGAQVNFDKAFRDATAWLPPNAAFRCEFVARQIAVKTSYQLWVSKNEKQAMAAVLDDC